MLLQWEAGDKAVCELWQTMNSWVYEGFDVTYKRLGVDFDKIYYESETYLLGKELVLRNWFCKGWKKAFFIARKMAPSGATSPMKGWTKNCCCAPMVLLYI